MTKQTDTPPIEAQTITPNVIFVRNVQVTHIRLPHVDGGHEDQWWTHGGKLIGGDISYPANWSARRFIPPAKRPSDFDDGAIDPEPTP